MPNLVYYSSKTGNTRHFVNRLGYPALEIEKGSAAPIVDEPYVLVVPTYAGDDGSGAVPKAVIAFLNIEKNRQLLRGVIAGGNRNFGKAFGLAGPVIAQKCHVPCLYRFELRGSEDDVSTVKHGLDKFWNELNEKH